MKPRRTSCPVNKKILNEKLIEFEVQKLVLVLFNKITINEGDHTLKKKIARKLIQIWDKNESGWVMTTKTIDVLYTMYNFFGKNGKQWEEEELE